MRIEFRDTTPAQATKRPYEHWPTDSVVALVSAIGGILVEEWYAMSELRARDLGAHLRNAAYELTERGVA